MRDSNSVCQSRGQHADHQTAIMTTYIHCFRSQKNYGGNCSYKTFSARDIQFWESVEVVVSREKTNDTSMTIKFGGKFGIDNILSENIPALPKPLFCDLTFEATLKVTFKGDWHTSVSGLFYYQPYLSTFI